MALLSVNINKLATLRNARGGNNPDLLKWASLIEEYGAQGITVHPRPDERHIRYADAIDLKSVVKTEYNIEGNPIRPFIDLVAKAAPHQVTLVPDSPDVLTSNAGWEVTSEKERLKDIIAELKDGGARVSLFMDPDIKQIEALADIGTDRIELYTEAYALGYHEDRDKAIAPYIRAAALATEMGFGLNAGHDLDLENLQFFNEQIEGLQEVSIGHALVCDALKFGMENTVQMYRSRLR